MDFVCICQNCSRTIEKEFLYCPWCGEKNHNTSNDEEIIEQVFSQLEKKQGEGIQKRISSMKNKLSELESELNRLSKIISEAE